MRSGWVVLGVLLLLPLAQAYHGQPGQAGLVAQGPVALEGVVDAHARPGAAFWRYAPDLDLALTAREIRVEVHEHRVERGPLALLADDGHRATARVHADPALDVLSRGHAFQLLAFQSGASEIRAHLGGQALVHRQEPALLVPTSEARADGLSRFGADAFAWGPREPVTRLSAPAPRVVALGDFTLFVYDALLRVADADGSATYRTGSWHEDDQAPARVPADTHGRDVAAFALIHVRGGRLEVAPNEGFEGLYAGALDLVVNGTARLAEARGSAVVGGERRLADGPAEFAGVLDASLSPVAGDGLRFEARGDVSALTLAGATVDYAPPLGVVEISLAVAAVAALAWIAKGGGLAALYSRFAGPQVLQHAERERILALLRAQPGLSVAETAERLGLSWSTTAYHLSVLAREGMVSANRRGRHRRYVVVGSGADREALVVSSHPTARALLQAIAASPGLSQQELAARVGITPSTASWHLKRLAQAGLVLVERAWRTRRYLPPGTESMRS